MKGKGRRAAERPLKRKVGTRRPRKTFVVFCEGERTEPEYLDALKRQPSVRDVAAVDLRVETGHGGSVPRTLVAMAAEARSKAIDEEAEIDEFWCVFDVEWPRNHPGLSEAVQRADSGVSSMVPVTRASMPRDTCRSQPTLPVAPPTSTSATCTTGRSSRRTTRPPACIVLSRQSRHRLALSGGLGRTGVFWLAGAGSLASRRLPARLHSGDISRKRG